ncbi:MAG: hypothetical protein R3181_06850, partial [Rubricoccaceae bacterium]|nr:hypothetical protein [Rubricoccaceae bacterium]
MILRRVAQHVREQNWTAIGIDFLIVVVGVFVAIEVSEWKSDRATQARAEMFTSRLTDDLRREAWGYEYVVAYTREVLANAEVAVAGASGDETISDEAFLVGAYRATQYRSYSRRQSTYEELVSTGDIGLITDDTLRAAATLLNNSRVIDTITEDGRTSEYRRVFRRRVPADVQRVLLASCGDRYVEPLDFQGIVGSLDYACDLDLAADR